MAQLNIDVTNEKDNGTSSMPPIGDYTGVIVNSELLENSYQTGYYLELEIQITRGELAGFLFSDRLNIVHEKTDTTQTYARQDLKAYLKALGLPTTLDDSVRMHNIEFSFSIALNRKQELVVRRHRPIDGSAPAQASAATPMHQQGFQAPPQTFAQPPVPVPNAGFGAQDHGYAGASTPPSQSLQRTPPPWERK